MRMRLYVTILALFFPVFLFGQATISINLPSTLPTLDFASLIISNNLQGSANFFQVTIDNAVVNASYFIKGTFSWKDIGSTDKLLATFTTKPFTTPSTTKLFGNSDLGNTIKIEEDWSDKTLINKNIAYGKPVGSYTIVLSLYLKDGTASLSSDTKSVNFENQTQTLSIISPPQGSVLDQGSVILSWTGIQGVQGNQDSYYFIRANQRTNPSQSLESALESGNRIINDKKLSGSAPVVNLRSVGLDREWQPGWEIVVAVGVKIAGIGGGQTFFSTPISFFLEQSITGSGSGGGTGSGPQTGGSGSPLNVNPSTAALSSVLMAFASSLPQALINSFLQSTVVISGITDENGNPLSQADILTKLNYFQAHPGDIVSIKFQKK